MASPATQPFHPCTLKALPDALHLEAAATAFRFNPVNRSPVAKLANVIGSAALLPAFIALLTTKYWGAAGVKLGVYFLDTTDSTLKNRILAHMNAWNQSANVLFSEASLSSAQVRIARTTGEGYWSYLGTDIIHVPQTEPTMNLESFGMDTPESEYRRVVRHETGHTLGFPHEHMRVDLVARLDVQKTLSYFSATEGWTAEETRQQVLTPLSEASLVATPVDVLSIMCYQLPGSITKDGQPIPGGLDIDPTDFALAAKVYPPPAAPPPLPPPGPGATKVVIPLAGTYQRVG